jgi:hydrogenase nickel incorporation protein HypB
MCKICGCDTGAKATTTNLQTGRMILLDTHSKGVEPHEHVRPDGTRYVHSHSSDEEPHAAASLVEIEIRVLEKNDALAKRNRAWLAERGILAVNLMSAPGAGKTTLLERTIREMTDARSLFVVEGDQATTNDAERIRAAGAPVVQVNTGTGCHLDAEMVASGLRELNPDTGSIVVIENVGNLVCPALFDVGEHRRIVVLSVTEGDDKPLKYPHMFRTADLVLLNKIDLLPYVDFDLSRAIANARAANPSVVALPVSARTGEGLNAWYAWLAAMSTAPAAERLERQRPQDASA